MRSALSCPSGIMRLLAPLFASACGARTRLHGRSAGEDWKVGLGKGILKRRWFFSHSSLFRALLVHATRGNMWPPLGLQISARNSRRSAGERGLFPSSPPRFLNGARADLARSVFGVSPQHCFRCSLFVFPPHRLFLPSFRKITRKKAVTSSLGATKEQGKSMRVVPRKNDIRRVSSVKKPILSLLKRRLGKHGVAGVVVSKLLSTAKNSTELRAISSSHPLAKSPPLLSIFLSSRHSPCL